MKDTVHILKKLYNDFESCSREQVLRTILYLVNVNSWNISPEEELLNLLIDKLLEITNKIYDIVDKDYLSIHGEVNDMIHKLIDDCSEILNLEKFVPQPKVSNNEKLYLLLRVHKISQEKVDKSEEIILSKHYKDLKVERFQNEYITFDNLEKLKKNSKEINISKQKLLLGAVISFFANFICCLPTKKERLEVFDSLTPTFKLIYESLYEALKK